MNNNTIIAWVDDIESWRKKHPFSYDQETNDLILPQHAIETL